MSTDKATRLAATGETSPQFRSSPATLISWDLSLILSKLPLLPHVFSPFGCDRSKPDALSPELDVSDYRNVLAIVEQAFLAVSSVLYLIGALALATLGPAFWLMGWVIGGGWMFYSWASRQKMEVWSKGPDGKQREERKDEAWIYVNGICSGDHWLTSSVDVLGNIFGREIHGIHNKTKGFFFDLLECIVQRDLAYLTQDAGPALYQAAKAGCEDPSKQRVVIIGHSQGGILVSLVLDQLLCDLPEHQLSKLEIYTFASAANHYNSPLNSSGQPIIIHIEHYYNEFDFVAGLGVANTQLPPGLDRRFFGREFMRKGATGHLLNQHYLSFFLSGWGEGGRLHGYLGGKTPGRDT